ncbi:hypothetical protein ORI89_10690 [Sphingobacterium sp. UT-1RO-CII-1]|uniref:hypothetical protein n=1 Tax=Sphingobacterium sp. UT-1RO-CII-1 TaxID=2995225 RepID=UPI00227B8D91|nr:hypothetical protein [Sphingobacterium sp. UT-1RO-CII-1]MCY4780120.1 hypothetical protein [Sphingobacterium sp. UT-1RO-CII-1]
MTVGIVKTPPLYITHDSTKTKTRAAFSFDGLNNSLLFILGTCQYSLYEKNSKKDFLSNNRLYFAADIFEAVSIIESTINHYEHQEKEKKIIKKINIQEVDWE